MKEILAFLFLICLTTVTIYLNATKQITSIVVASLLFFSILSSFLIANYDIIKKLKYKNLEIETFASTVAKVKQTAIDEVRQDVERQKHSLGKIADTLTKMAYVVADGSSRFGGTPEPHMKKLEEYRASLHEYTDPNLEKEIKRTLESLNSKINSHDA